MCCQKTPGCCWRFRKDHGLVSPLFSGENSCANNAVEAPHASWKNECSHHMFIWKPWKLKTSRFPGVFEKNTTALEKFKKKQLRCMLYLPAHCTDPGWNPAPLMKSINSMTAWCTCHEDSKNSGISIHHTYKVLTFFLTHTHTRNSGQGPWVKNPPFSCNFPK